jgi:lipid II:glycine glycyltransferase (peptidoglycan interpeptide bridge formation enzyme)
LKQGFGWDAGRAVVSEGTGPGAPIIAGASLLFRRLPWGQALAYVPKGPLADFADAAQAGALLAELRRVCRRWRAALLKIEPDLPAASELGSQLRALGFRPSAQRVQPLSTMVIDLDAGDEALLARMKPKWRYNIRLAEKKGVCVRPGTAGDLRGIQGLMARTGQRDGFAVHSPDYYEAATRLFVPAGLADWLVAEHEGQLLAAIAVFALGAHAWYMWGASADDGRSLMPNHALQWAAIRWARARGCRYYDLWGIPDEVGANPEAFANPECWGHEGLWGVYRFKQGFGGQVVRFTGAWDLPLSPPGYAVYRLGLRLSNRKPRSEAL